MRYLAPFLLLACSPLALLWLSEPAQQTGKVAAFFPPWWSLGELLDAVAEAGDVIGIPTLPFVLTISGDPRHIDARLHQAGAIMVLHRALPFICSNG